MSAVAIFGCNGSIGSYLTNYFAEQNHMVYSFTRDYDFSNIAPRELSAVVYAQGANLNDSLETYSESNLDECIRGNCKFILQTLRELMSKNKISIGANVCIISSIWEEYSRDNKLSYTISKAATGGLMRGLIDELGKYNIKINNVLPAVIDNHMSRSTLTEEQIKNITDLTPFKRLVDLQDVASLVYYLCTQNTGVSGQSISVDLGLTKLRKYS